ncbi:MAG: S41 family peptidase, partial [Chitinophagaceae bacterium]|nr:S41 family peptidase [Chitinophagaceae bacterium]
HYSPRAVDDDFSKALWEDVLESIDPYYVYLKPADLKELEAYKTKLDNELKGESWAFLNLLEKQLMLSAADARKFIEPFLSKPLNYTQPDFFVSAKSRLQIPAVADDADWRKRWQQYLQWSIMNQVHQKWERKNADKPDSLPLPDPKNDWFINTEKDTRSNLARRYDEHLKAWAENPGELAETLAAKYLSALAEMFDPHTNYLDPIEKNAFTNALSSESLIFGIELESDEAGEVSIAGIAPGSAAWNSGNIFKQDKLKEIKMPDGKVVSIKDLSSKQLSELLGSIEKEEVEFLLQSADGKEKRVKLQKQEIENEENLVRGYVLSGPQKIGYISLPSFYTEWDDNQSSSCANDIAKEIIKLKRENIEGLIFDLRYNGGGSLQEAVDISGIFIEAGPMSIIKERDGKKQTLKDPSRGSIYDGPLVVMVNGQSASASELVAATLQDYSRAIILGSPTFGKATMQVVYPLDSAFNPEAAEKGLGGIDNRKDIKDFLKITTGALFRISGSSNQFNGVIPDIWLPDLFETTEYSEKKLPHALKPDTITKSVAYNPLPASWKSSISTIEAGLKTQQYFSDIQLWNSRQHNAQQTAQKIPLQWHAFSQWVNNNPTPDESQKKYEDLIKGFKVQNSAFTERLLELESNYKKEQNKTLIEAIAADYYIQAAFACLTQLISPK